MFLVQYRKVASRFFLKNYNRVDLNWSEFPTFDYDANEKTFLTRSFRYILKEGTICAVVIYNNDCLILANCEARMLRNIWRENVRLQSSGNHEHKYVRHGELAFEYILIDNAALVKCYRRLACADLTNFPLHLSYFVK